MEFLKETRISRRHAQLRIDQFLARRFGYLSRAEWQAEIRRGKIYLNGTVMPRHDRRIREGDCIAYAGRDAVEPAVDTGYSILYEDDFILGVDKPGNLPVHPAGVFYHNTLLSFLKKRYCGTLHLVNRLDRETSGVVLLARDPGVAAYIQREFSLVRKAYLALVHGKPDTGHFIIDVPIDADTVSGLEHRRTTYPKAGQAARTSFTVLQSYGSFSLLKAVPFTGRQHQIRVHCLHAGYPVIGDKLYGIGTAPAGINTGPGSSDRQGPRPMFSRSALHSRSIRFRHPVLDRWICLRAALPEDMRQLITREHTAHG
jgi:RluA family pseudouridine synthase